MVEGLDREKYPGSGLGLTLVHRLVELLNGEIKVESELGKGSTFTVILPLEHGATATEVGTDAA
jgi:signal transduction histidine kinase